MMKQAWNAVCGIARALAITAVLMPSLAMNVWPKLSQLIASGWHDGNATALVLLSAVSVPLMAGGIMAISKAANWGLKTILSVICVGLCIMNLGNATEVASMFRDAGSEPRRDLIKRAASLDSRIAAATRSRAQLTAGGVATDATVAAAQRAVDSAHADKEKECLKVGENCRQRVLDEQAARDALARALEEKGLTDIVKQADKKIATLQAQRDALGPIPIHADPVAARISAFLGLLCRPFGGHGPDADTVSEWWPIVVGFGAELIAMFGPLIILTVFPPPLPPTPEQVEKEQKAAARNRRRRAAAKKVSPSAIPPSRDSVREWKKASTADRPGEVIRVGVAYDAYCAWCKEAKYQPVTLTAFGLTMKNELGVKSSHANNRSHYLGLAITGKPRLAATG